MSDERVMIAAVGIASGRLANPKPQGSMIQPDEDAAAAIAALEDAGFTVARLEQVRSHSTHESQHARPLYRLAPARVEGVMPITGAKFSGPARVSEPEAPAAEVDPAVSLIRAALDAHAIDWRPGRWRCRCGKGGWTSDVKWQPGDRFVVAGSPWPEREGFHGTVLAPRTDGRYPQPAPGEVLVMIDNDPCADRLGDDRWWSCVMRESSIQPIDPAAPSTPTETE